MSSGLILVQTVFIRYQQMMTPKINVKLLQGKQLEEIFLPGQLWVVARKKMDLNMRTLYLTFLHANNKGANQSVHTHIHFIDCVIIQHNILASLCR